MGVKSGVMLIDFNQISILNLMAAARKGDFDPAIVRHMVLSYILSFRKKYRKDYPKIVICCDSPVSWRRTIFPQYKATRARMKAQSQYDWKAIGTCLHEMKLELREVFPYQVIEVAGAEGDDVIGCLCDLECSRESEVLIISGDKDFVQLHNPLVQQFSPFTKQMVQHHNPKEFLQEHIIIGDRSDGIPNILSPINALADGIRQASVYREKLRHWVKLSPVTYCKDEHQMLRYRQNEKLINLRLMPRKLKMAIEQAYFSCVPAKGDAIYKYLIKMGLVQLLTNVEGF